MKNTIQFLTFSIGLVMMSCSADPAKTEVIVAPTQADKTHTIVVEKEAPEKSTTIVLDKNGVKIDTKKMDVELKEE